MLTLKTPDGLDLAVEVRDLIVAGWAGRDRAAVDHHIAELAELGVAPPSSVPLYYRVSADRLTTAPRLQVLGGDGSGEAEAVILGANGRLWVGVGSDHTDRKVESYSVAVSKEMCPKPMGASVWAFDEVKDHWDELILRSFATVGGARVLYQEGKVSALLPPAVLVAGWEALHGPFGDGRAMLCGTLPAIGGIRPADRFEIELEDPVLRRRLTHAYEVEVLPVVA
jgi:hypothetical protein